MSLGAGHIRACALAACTTTERHAQVAGAGAAIPAHVTLAAVGACVGAAVLAAGAALRPRHSARSIRRDRGSGTQLGLGATGSVTAGTAAAAPNARQASAPAVRALRILAVATLAIGAGPFAAITAALVAVLIPRWRRTQADARQRRAVAAAYPDAIDMVVLGVRAGLLPAAALAAVSGYVPFAVRPAFAAVVVRVERGDRFADALIELETHIGSDARPLIDSFAAADRYGLPLAPVLERLATEARQQRRRVADTAARQLPVRLSLPLVLCTLPSFVLLAIVPLLLGAFSSLHTQ